MLDKFRFPYDPAVVEKATYKKWENSGFFDPDKLPSASMGPYTIVMPPPNANGDLHAGHVLFITLEDIFIRFKRMQGYRALWIPGADHAGFETQVVYEKQLEKEGRSRFGMDPQKLYKEIYDFTIANKANMEAQVRQLGASCDWGRERFTLDPDIVLKVQGSFIKMFKDGLVYRGKRTVNWCFKHQTSLSDVETEAIEEKADLYYLRYGPFEIATARPETKFGDKYVVMHPEDERYSKWKHGDTFKLEWINGPITATVIKDSAIDMEFGTGVMTITPWHSQVDFEIAQRHDLDIEQIIDWRGKLLPIAEEFQGLKITEARKKIVEKLRSKGLVSKIDSEYVHVLKHCYKCNTVIEPQILAQWFVKMRPLADMALASVDRKEIRFIPDNYEKIFRYWMENTLDWNISRQIVWGIPIPAYLCDACDTYKATLGEIIPSCDSCGEQMRKDTDTFDTWFSSGQWPLLVTHYPDGKDFLTHYPTDVMETGRDLIFKWVPRMIMFGLYLAEKAPFHSVYLHGLVNDAHGKKMSKSKGNVISPLTLIEKYGTDALRMGLVIGNTPGTDLSLSDDRIKGYKHFANKVWNISRFVLENQDNEKVSKNTFTSEDDMALLSEFQELKRDVTNELENYHAYLAAEKIYHYLWDRFANEILEESKILFRDRDEHARDSRASTLLTILMDSLKLLHPFMPFITEEIWGSLPNTGELLMVEKWPIGA